MGLWIRFDESALRVRRNAEPFGGCDRALREFFHLDGELQAWATRAPAQLVEIGAANAEARGDLIAGEPCGVNPVRKLRVNMPGSPSRLVPWSAHWDYCFVIRGCESTASQGTCSSNQSSPYSRICRFSVEQSRWLIGGPGPSEGLGEALRGLPGRPTPRDSLWVRVRPVTLGAGSSAKSGPLRASLATEPTFGRRRVRGAAASAARHSVGYPREFRPATPVPQRRPGGPFGGGRFRVKQALFVMLTSTSNLLTWTLRAIARLERGGLRPPRLTEPDHERWHRVRRKLGWVAFIELLHEDLADAFPTSFALDRWSVHPTAELDDTAAKALVDDAGGRDDADLLAFLRLACRGLGLMEGGNIAALPKVQTHQHALELSGCGGRIAAHQVATHGGLSFNEHFAFVAETDAERVAIGLAAVELRANAPRIFTVDQLRTERPRFDHVFGIKGYSPAEQVASDLGLEVRWA